mmetsp:Transcript_54603/g.170719  ORF Transcript_54603/g.170719 Transcript_54603/m.170719 type:complete len:279 (-) Transcript_54603:1009-1845(-)
MRRRGVGDGDAHPALAVGAIWLHGDLQCDSLPGDLHGLGEGRDHMVLDLGESAHLDGATDDLVGHGIVADPEAPLHHNRPLCPQHRHDSQEVVLAGEGQRAAIPLPGQEGVTAVQGEEQLRALVRSLVGDGHVHALRVVAVSGRDLRGRKLALRGVPHCLHSEGAHGLRAEARTEQRAGSGVVVLPQRLLEGGPAVPLLLGAPLEQYVDGAGLAAAARKGQGGPTILIAEVGVALGLQEQPQGPNVPVLRRQHQGGHPAAGEGVHADRRLCEDVPQRL